MHRYLTPVICLSSVSSLSIFKATLHPQHALRSKSKSKEKKEHWLDYASDKYEPKLINDVKILLKILVLYIPLPFFWALFDQQVRMFCCHLSFF